MAHVLSTPADYRVPSYSLFPQRNQFAALQDRALVVAFSANAIAVVNISNRASGTTQEFTTKLPTKKHTRYDGEFLDTTPSHVCIVVTAAGSVAKENITITTPFALVSLCSLAADSSGRRIWSTRARRYSCSHHGNNGHRAGYARGPVSTDAEPQAVAGVLRKRGGQKHC